MLIISSVPIVIMLSGEFVSLFFIFGILNMYSLSIEMFRFSSVGQFFFNHCDKYLTKTTYRKGVSVHRLLAPLFPGPCKDIKVTGEHTGGHNCASLSGKSYGIIFCAL